MSIPEKIVINEKWWVPEEVWLGDQCRIAELESTIQAMTETAAEQSRVHVEMHDTIIALNETNSQLAHRLWCIENPE